MAFFESFLQSLNPLIKIGCIVHDFFSDFLLRNLKLVKIGLLLLAHLTLIGFFFPEYGKSYGSMAQVLLLVIVLVSPLAKLFRMKLLYQILGLRRELGIWFGYVAIVHGLSFMLNPNWAGMFIEPYISHPFDIMPRYIYGFIALVLTLPLLITSNSLSTRILKGNWKRLHYLVYPIFGFMLLHIFLPTRTKLFGIDAGWFQFALVFGGYIFLKILANNNFITPLRQINEHVGKQYKEFVAQKNVTKTSVPTG